MVGFEVQKSRQADESAWPVKSARIRVDLDVNFDGDVPPKAQRRMAFEQLLRLLEEAEESDLQFRLSKTTDVPELGRWERPEDLDLRVVKSAHRVIAEIAKRGLSGRQVLASELVGSIGLSAPTLGRLLRDGEDGHDYLRQYVRVSPSGRTKALDLTPEGRVLASRIRAGAVPA